MRRTAVVGALRAAIRPAEPIMVLVKMAGRSKQKGHSDGCLAYLGTRTRTYLDGRNPEAESNRMNNRQRRQLNSTNNANITNSKASVNP